MEKVENVRILSHRRPDIAKEWHPTKNDKTPDDFTCGSRKKVWWKCQIGHEWDAIINSRKAGNGCPVCSGKRKYLGGSLATLRPDLALEWHTEKNEKNPDDYTCGSNKKVWWRCSKGHEWEKAIWNRNAGSGCPVCSKK